MARRFQDVRPRPARGESFQLKYEGAEITPAAVRVPGIRGVAASGIDFVTKPLSERVDTGQGGVHSFGRSKLPVRLDTTSVQPRERKNGFLVPKPQSR